MWFTPGECECARRERDQEAASAKGGAVDQRPTTTIPEAVEQALASSCSLSLVKHRITDVDATLIDRLIDQLDATQAWTKLTTLDLRGNAIGDAGARALASRIAAHEVCAVETLQLWSCRIGADGVAAVLAALAANRSVRTLDIGNQLPERDERFGCALASGLASALRHSATLTSVDVRYSSLCDAGAATLGDALPAIAAPLRRLDVRYNGVGAAGLRALAAGLADAAASLPLLHVHVQPNAYSDRDAAAFADELEAVPRFAALAHGPERLWF